MMYYVNWVLTNAQIDLIAADVSVVDYSNKNDKKKRKKGEYDNTSADSGKVKEAADKWLNKYGDGKDAGQGLSVGDILGGGMRADVGVRLQ